MLIVLSRRCNYTPLSIKWTKWTAVITWLPTYSGADKSLARPTSRCILFDGENNSFDASLYNNNNNNVPPIMIINKIYENQNLLLL